MNNENNEQNKEENQSPKPNFLFRRTLILILFAVVCVTLFLSPYLGLAAAVLFVIFFYVLFPLPFEPNLYLDLLPKTKEEPAVRQISSSELWENVPLPYTIINQNQQILVCNHAFRNLFQRKIGKNAPIQSLLSGYRKNEKKQKIKIANRQFQILSKEIPLDSQSDSCSTGYAVCLIDITDSETLKENIDSQKTVIALIFIDNYEEVIESMEDASVPLLTALIERKLNSLATQIGGVVRKFEKDRYLFILTQEKLEELKEKKFEILNEVREINIGEHIPVTLSIGIGVGAKTLDAAMKSARAAIDLALGRGGDQVLIKEEEKYLFYGGKSGEVSHNSRIRARVKADALSELIGESSEIFTMGHTHADLDCLGSSIGICKIANTLGKECYIILDHISPGIKKLYKRMVESGLENKFITSAEALERMTSKTLLVITDTHRHSILECGDVLNQANKVVVFDHHRKSTDFIENAVLFYHEPYASSTCELVTEIIQYIGEKIKLKPIEADALLAGITVDTKNFCVKTGAITFEAAAYLRRNGADSIRVRLLFQDDIDAHRAKAAAIRNAEIFMDHIALSICEPDMANTTITAAQAADDLLNITGIKASFVFCQLENKIYISARSFGDINVQVILEKLGGGGHQTVSGAQLPGADLYETKELMKQIIQDYLQEEN